MHKWVKIGGSKKSKLNKKRQLNESRREICNFFGNRGKFKFVGNRGEFITFVEIAGNM